jgi:hypothetical protein
MSASYPIPPHTRQTTLAASSGQTIFGPFDWILFDPGDVKIFVKAVGSASYAQLAPEQFTVAPAAPAVAFPALFTITLLTARTAGDLVRIQGARTSARTTDVTRAGALQSQLLENELDRQVVTGQELRRDVDLMLGATAIDAANILADTIAARDAAAASAAALGNQVRQYDTVVQAMAAIIPNGVKAVRVAGLNAIGDLGAEQLYKWVAAEPSHSSKFQSADGAWWERVTISVARLGKPRSGLVPANHPTAPNTKLVFPAGFIADKDNTLDIVFPTGLIKTTSAWAPGNDAGMLDQGAIAVNSGYWLHAIHNPATQQNDILASLSADNPLLPNGWTRRARMPWSFMTDASGFIYAARWYASGYMELETGPTVAANRSLQFSSLLFLQLPIGAKLRARCLVTLNNVAGGNPSFYFLFRDPDLAAPGSAAQAAAFKPVGLFDGLVVEAAASAAGEVYTGSSPASANNQANIILLGYADLGDEFA